MKIGRITISDRASAGIYDDLSGPAIEEALAAIFHAESTEYSVRLIPDEKQRIELALIELTDAVRCDLVLTTGGTGPSQRDITPEATRTVITKELPGFGEIMRMKSFKIAPTAILSRATAGIRGRSLIVNLPGSPKAVRECLAILGPALREGIKHLRE